MIGKIGAAARLLNMVLAIVGGLVTLPGVDVTTALIILGLFGGIGIGFEILTTLAVMAIAFPVIAAVVAHLPGAGAHLSAIVGNFGVGVASSVLVAFAFASAQNVKRELDTLNGK